MTNNAKIKKLKSEHSYLINALNSKIFELQYYESAVDECDAEIQELQNALDKNVYAKNKCDLTIKIQSELLTIYLNTAKKLKNDKNYQKYCIYDSFLRMAICNIDAGQQEDENLTKEYNKYVGLINGIPKNEDYKQVGDIDKKIQECKDRILIEREALKTHHNEFVQINDELNAKLSEKKQREKIKLIYYNAEILPLKQRIFQLKNQIIDLSPKHKKDSNLTF